MAKRRKQRMRRAWFKAFSKGRMNSGPSKETIAEYNARVNRQVIAGTPLDKTVEGLLARARSSKDPRAVMLARHLDHQTGSIKPKHLSFRQGKLEAIWTSKHIQNEDTDHYFKVRETSNYRLVLYWCRSNEFGEEFLFHETNHITQTVRVSKTYKSKDLAMKFYRMGIVSWRETMQLD